MDNPQVLISPAARAAMRHFFDRYGSRGAGIYTQLQDTIRVALADALHDVYLVTLGVVIAAAIAALFLREVPLRRAAAEPVEDEALGEALPESGPGLASG
jgi:hypothetical protein